MTFEEEEWARPGGSRLCRVCSVETAASAARRRDGASFRWRGGIATIASVGPATSRLLRSRQVTIKYHFPRGRMGKSDRLCLSCTGRQASGSRAFSRRGSCPRMTFPKPSGKRRSGKGRCMVVNRVGSCVASAGSSVWQLLRRYPRRRRRAGPRPIRDPGPGPLASVASSRPSAMIAAPNVLARLDLEPVHLRGPSKAAPGTHYRPCSAP